MANTDCGARIKYIRTKHTGEKISMLNFAKSIGVSQGAVALWETGERNPSTTALKNIAVEYGIDETWLITGKGSVETDTPKKQEIDHIMKMLYSADENSYEYKLAVKLSHLTPKQWQIVRQVIDIFSDL